MIDYIVSSSSRLFYSYLTKNAGAKGKHMASRQIHRHLCFQIWSQPHLSESTCSVWVQQILFSANTAAQQAKWGGRGAETGKRASPHVRRMPRRGTLHSAHPVRSSGRVSRLHRSNGSLPDLSLQHSWLRFRETLAT